MKKKVYLSKSKVADSEQVELVQQELDQLSKEFDFEVVQFNGGYYSTADHTKMLGCDLLLMIPPEDQSFEDINSWDIGKGQHAVIRDYLNTIRPAYVLDCAYVDYESEWEHVSNAETNNISDYVKRFAKVQTDKSHVWLKKIIEETCTEKMEEYGRTYIDDRFTGATYEVQTRAYGHAGELLVSSQNGNAQWQTAGVEIGRVVPMLAVSLL